MEPLSAVCAWDETALKVKVTLVMISHEQAESRSQWNCLLPAAADYTI